MDSELGMTKEDLTNKKLEVAQLIYDNVAIKFDDLVFRGTVCFSKDGTWYSAAGGLVQLILFYFLFVRRSATNARCRSECLTGSK